MKKTKILLTMVLVVLLTACSTKGNDDGEAFVPSGDHPVVTMTMQSGDVVEMELYPEVAPNTVNSFISLIEDNYYNGLIFHRVIPGFMIQGGDPTGTGTGGPGYTIPGEFSSNKHENNLKHTRGVLSMARSGHPDSAGSQFFIMVEDAPHLDGEYASFGKVISGEEVLDKIVMTETKADKPIDPQVIESMTVELNGYKVKEVKRS